VVGAAQQIQQRLFIVFAGGAQGDSARFEFDLELRRIEAVGEQLLARQFVDHTRVLQQIARGPLGSAQQAQQALVHRRPLLQQRQVTVAAQHGFDPVGHAQRGFFAHAALFEPGAGALHQPHQAKAAVFLERQHARVLAPLRHPGRKRFRELRQHALKIVGRAAFAVATLAVAAPVGGAAQQRVELLRHQFAVGIERVQELAHVGATHGRGHPGQVVVAVVQVLDAVLDPAQKTVGLRQRVG